MSEHSDKLSLAIRENKKLTFPVKESNKSRSLGKLRYWRCWLAASVLFLFTAFPLVVLLWLINRCR